MVEGKVKRKGMLVPDDGWAVCVHFKSRAFLWWNRRRRNRVQAGGLDVEAGREGEAGSGGGEPRARNRRRSSSLKSSVLKKIRELTFDSSTMEDDECTVCFEQFQDGDLIRSLPVCHHTFHKVCIDAWLGIRRPTCPICRRDTLVALQEEGNGAGVTKGSTASGEESLSRSVSSSSTSTTSTSTSSSDSSSSSSGAESSPAESV
ncbi:RING-type domain-containing protein [Chloropicon primus]|nr:RING-type domain-containing protein [Chloropicon primus]